MSLCTLTRPRPQTADEHRLRSWAGVGLVAVACLAAEAAGGLLTAGPVRSWYPDLSAPAVVPPDWVFGPARSLMFAGMAAAGALVWLARDRDDVCCPLTGFGLQLVAGLGWGVLFFGVHNPLLALLAVAVQWALLGLTVAHFFTVSRAAAGLMLPYWAWVTYAAVLNGSVVFRMV